MTKQLFTINEAAKLLGVSIKTLRRWDEKGLLKAQRTIGNQRRYDIEDLEKLKGKKIKSAIRKQQTDTTPRQLSISEAAAILGISVKTLRRWEAKGIITSHRSPTNQRYFLTAELNALKNAKTEPTATPISTPVIARSEERTTKQSYADSEISALSGEAGFARNDKHFHPFAISHMKFAQTIFPVIGIIIAIAAFGGTLTLTQVGVPAARLLSFLPQNLIRNTTTDSDSQVLQSATERRDFALRISVPVEILATASVSGNLTAPNIVYSVLPGDNITISGDPQNPVISAEVALDAGTGIEIAGGTITNADPGSAQNIFSSILIGSTTLTAGSNTSQFELAAGDNITLSTDTSNNKITIAADVPTPDPGIDGIEILEGGTSVLITATGLDFLGGDFDVGESPPGTGTIQLASTLTSVTGVAGNFGIGGSLTLNGDTINDFTGTDTGLEVSSGVLTLITTCADNEILKYTALGGWECGSDAGAGAAVAGMGAQNQIAYWTNATTIAGDNDFYWDSTFERFAIGTGGNPVGKITVNGAATGKALAILNETGDQDLLTASASGTTQLIVDRTGNLTIEGALADLSGTVLTINDNLKVTGNEIIDSADVTRIALGSTTTITATNLTLSGTSTLDATALTAINGGLTAINFDEFDVSAANGGITINDDGNAGHITIEDTRLDLDSLDFVTAGAITTAAGNDLTITAGGGNLLLSSGTTLNVGGGTASAFNFFADSVAGADATILGSDNDLYIEDDLEVDGQTRFGNITYTWPGTIAANDYVLQTQTDGTLEWVDATTLGTNYWDQIAGVLTPKIQTLDLLLGSQATESARFAVININTGTPTASLSAGVTGATYLTANGELQTTNYQSLTLGGSDTGNIVLGNSGLASCTALETVNGVITCGTDDAGSAGTNYWQLADGAISPFSETLDVLFGATATSSAEFAITGIANGTPTATLSATTTGNGLSLSAANATIQSLQNSTLTIGGDSTGNIALSDLTFANAGLTLPSGQNLTLAGLTGNNAVLYATPGTGVVAAATTNTDALCLTSSSGTNIPTWTACPGSGSGSSKWTLSGNVIYPNTINQQVGIGTTTAGDVISSLYVTRDLDSGALGKALAILDQTEDQDIFTASASGTTRFTIANDGTIYSNGIEGQTVGTASCVTTTNGIVTGTSSCPAVAANDIWQQEFGTIFQGNTTQDLLIGGVATESAKFAVLNINPGSGTPTASLSGQTGGAFLTADGRFATTNKQSLAIGDANTGNILIGDGATDRIGAGISIRGGTNDQYVAEFYGRDSQYAGFGVFAEATNARPFIQFGDNAGTSGVPTADWSLVSNTSLSSFEFKPGNAAANYVLSIGQTGNLAIEGSLEDVSDPVLRIIDSIDVQGSTNHLPIASLSASTSFAGLIVDNTIGDLFTASSSGLSRFTIANNGTIYSNGVAGQTIGTATCVTTTNGIVTGTGSCDSPLSSFIWNTSADGGAIIEGNITRDLLIGGEATTSAKFAVLNVSSDNPTASLSAGISGGAYLTADGQLLTTNKQQLTVGGTTTGGIAIGTDATDRTITIGNTTGSTPLVIESGTGGINLGDTANLKTIDIGGVTNSGTDTIRIATNNSAADTITIGNNNASTTLALTGGDDWSIAATGLATFSQLTVDNLSLDGTTLSSSADLIIDATGDDVVSTDRFTLGSTTASALATLDVRALSGTLSVATVSGQTSFASLVVDNELGDIFTASASGRTRLALANNGELRLYDADASNYTGFKTPANITSNAVYTFPTALPIASNYVLISDTDGSLSWVDAGSLPSVNYWDQGNGSIYPKNAESFDLLLGATASNAAEFAVTGISSGTPVATLSATTTGNGLSLSAANATIQSLQNSTLTLGGTTTGNIALLPQNGTGFTTATGRLGINTTTTPLAALDVRSINSTSPAASVSANSNSFAGLVVDNAGIGDIFTASTGGVPKFTIQNNGTLVSSHYTTAGGIFYGSADGAISLSDAGVAGQILQSNGTGAPTWVASSTINFWQRDLGAIAPLNITDDFLLGAAATESARFAVLNIAGGIPVATLSAGINGGALLTANGQLQTTAFQTLTLGSGDTGDISITPKSGGTLHLTTDNLRINNLPGATSASLTCVSVENGIVTAAGGCGAGSGGSVWTVGEATGVIYPQNPTLDLLIGGTATASAKFAVLNVAGSLTPIASVSAGTAGAAYLTASGNLATTANQTLSFGGATTGNILFNPVNGTGFSTFNGKLGINTTNLFGTLDVRSNTTNGGTIPIASLSGNTAMAGLIVDNSGSGDLLTASSSGLPRFVIAQNGKVGIGTTLPSATLDITGIGTGNSIISAALRSAPGSGIGRGNQLVLDNLTGATTFKNQISFQSAGSEKWSLGNDGSGTGLQTFFLHDAVAGATRLYIDAEGKFGLNTGGSSTPPRATLDIRGATATNSIASISGATNAGFASLVVDNSGTGDVFAASSSGLTRFVIKQNGDLQIGNLTYTFPSAQGADYILQNDGSGVLSWIDPGDLPNTNNWFINDGAIAPKTASVVDLLIGGTATASAKFAVLNINGDATPIASLSATTASGGNGNGIVLNANGSIQTLRNNTLTLGGDTTGLIAIDGTIITPSGDLILDPVDELVLANTKNLIVGGHVGNIDYNVFSNSANTNHGLNADNDLFIEGELEVDGTLFADGSIDTALTQGLLIFPDSNGVLTQDSSNLYYDDTNNRFGVGVASNLRATLDVRGTLDTLAVASVSGKSNSFAAMVVDNRGNGDLFTASRSGLTKFTIGLDRIQIGTGSATGAGGAETPQLLGLDSKGSTGDPSNGRQGDMYYNTVDDKFRCYQGTGWRDCIAISASEYLRAELNTTQNTAGEIDSDDHVKFDTVQSSSGSSISLDTTSSYVEGGTGASIGRFTLTAGKTYRLSAKVMAVYGTADSQATYRWYNITNSTYIGSGAYNNSTNRNDSTSSGDEAETIITPTVNTLVELRFSIGVGNISSIQPTSNGTSAYIEVLSGNMEVSAHEYLRAEQRTNQTSNFTADTDRIKFDTVDAYSGSSISLSTAAYGSGGSRFTLAAGKTYLLRASVSDVIFTDNTDLAHLGFRWYNVTSSSYTGSAGIVAETELVGFASDAGYSGYAEAIISTTATTTVEVRINANGNSGITQIGNSAAARYSNAYIEVLSDNTKVAQFTGATSSTDGALGYIPAPVAGQQGALLLGNGEWTDRTNAFIGTTLTEPIASLSARTSFAGLVVDNQLGDLFTASSSGLTRFVITQAGDVGIGTANPSQILDITGGAMEITGNTGTAIADTFTGTTQQSYIHFPAVSGSNDPGFIMFETQGSGDTNEGVIHLSPSDDNAYGDYVSIHGTNDPDTLKLHTNGTIDGILNASASGTLSFIGSTDPKINILNGESFGIRTSPGGDAGVTERFTILNNGNVGIGTTVPSTQLQLHLSTGGELLLTRDDSTTAVNELLGGIGFDSDDGNVPSNILHASAGIYGYAAESHATTDKGGYLTFNTSPIDQDDDTANVERMRLTSEGYLGIATTNPTFHLYVDGVTAHTITNYGFLSSAGAGTFTSINTNYSAFFASSIWVSAEVHADSDQREKNLVDVIDPQVALDAVSKLRPLHFQWKPELNKGNGVIAGFFAQEVEHIIPEAVSIQQGNLYADQRTMNYNQLTAVTISALQGLNKKVDATNAALFANLAITPSGDLNIDAGEIQTQALNVSGNLEAQTLTLGGTNLNDRLLGLESGFASASAGFASPLASLQTQVLSLQDKVASLEARLDLLTASGSAFFNPNFGNFTASSGAELSLDSLEVNGNILIDSLNVLGYTTMNELSVTGSIRTGVLTIKGQSNGGASISTLNGDLRLQDQGFGGIDILDGLITIDTSGNVQTVGEITAKKFNVDTTSVSGASAGTVTISAGTTILDVDTTALTPDSLIFVTPNRPVVIGAERKDSNTFTIRLGSPAATNIKVNWWIVN